MSWRPMSWLVARILRWLYRRDYVSEAERRSLDRDMEQDAGADDDALTVALSHPPEDRR